VLEEPRDFLGYLLAHAIENQLQDPEFISRVKTWKMTVVLETNYYPLTMVFDNGLKIIRKAVENPTLIVKISMDTINQIIKEECSPLKAFFKGNIKVKGLFRHPIAMKRFYGLLTSGLRG
jgi:putative sterol carrier protein